MSPTDAVRSVLSHDATFSGRSRRSEFWWFTLFSAVLSLVLGIVDRAIGSSILGYVVSLALLLPTIAVTVRRLHDTGRSGLWYLIVLIPVVGAIILIVWCAKDSEPEPNRFGPSPKPGVLGQTW